MYWYVPALVKVCVNCVPAASLPDVLLNFSGPSQTSMLCPLSRTSQVTASPVLTVTALGAKSWLSTTTVAGAAQAGVLASASAAAIAVVTAAGTDARGRMGVSPPAGLDNEGDLWQGPTARVRPALVVPLPQSRRVIPEGSRTDAPSSLEHVSRSSRVVACISASS